MNTISVIVPVYNIEHKKIIFLNTIKSVLNQSYHNLELILVNDGSTDSSVTLLENIQSRDGRIKIVSKKNGGVESARREGLKHVSGNYILHLDQDDLYVNGSFKHMLEVAEQSGADCVVGNSSRFIFNRMIRFGEKNTPSMRSSRVIDHQQFMNDYYQSFFGINDLPVNIWNKLYKRSFIEKTDEPPLTNCILEDLSYNMHVLPYATKIAIMPNITYLYRWGGWTNHYDKTILQTALTGYELKRKLIEYYSLNESYRHTTAVELLNYINSYFKGLLYYDQYRKDQFIDEASRVIALPSVHDALSKVATGIKRFPHIQAMIDNDCSQLYVVNMKDLHDRSLRNFFKRLALAFS